jgi:hypothetical protein
MQFFDWSELHMSLPWPDVCSIYRQEVMLIAFFVWAIDLASEQ